MDIKSITIVVRGAQGQAVKAVFDAKGGCTQGDASAVQSALALVAGSKPAASSSSSSSSAPASGESKSKGKGKKDK